MNRLLQTSIISLSLGVFGACGGEDDDGNGGTGRAEEILALTGDANAGSASFSTCASSSCHGSDGTAGGNADRNLAVKVPSMTEAQLVDVILNGSGDMAAQSQLENQDIADIVAYLKETFQ